MIVVVSPPAFPNVALPSIVNVPFALMLPLTVSLSAGVNVPIPSLPSSANIISPPLESIK